MVMKKFFYERNFDRPKNGRIFNFVRFAWNLVSRVYEESWTRWWWWNFSANEISTARKTAEFSTLSDLLEIWYLGYMRCPENDGDEEIFLRMKFRPSENRSNFQLCPIGLNLVILGIWGVLKTMVMMKFFCERNFDRPKNVKFSTVSNWLEIWYFGFSYLKLAAHGATFAIACNSKKLQVAK